MKVTEPLLKIAIVIGLISNVACTAEKQTEKTEHNPAAVTIGERLFLETRFAQAYFANPGKSDPALQYTLTMDEPLAGPFAGKTINCRTCHLVDEQLENKSAGMRSYADFIHNSPVPKRNDGHHVTPRNAMSLVNISIGSSYGALFHFDGEFNSMQDLVVGTLTGRNYGWLADESEQAIKHIATIIRTDDGQDELGKEFGGSYQKILTAKDKDIAAEFLLPEEYRIDVSKAGDKQIVDAVAKLIAAYVTDLNFARDEQANYTGSPYDQFLKLNHLPRQPRDGESAQQYAERLLAEVNQLESPKYVSSKDLIFKYHNQAFVFGEQELQGMKLFFTRGNQIRTGGNCISCHTAPHFSDFGFHNTGLSQVNYDEQHGNGTFVQLAIPNLEERNQNYDQYLPATAIHPEASEKFRSVVNIDKPGYTDLGLWNVFANPDMPAPQVKLKKILCEKTSGIPCSEEALLPFTIAVFKTPVLRDLGHSNPYLHNGQFNTLKEVIGFYVISSTLAKQGKIRNADPELSQINISGQDVKSLVAFLKALNEDYD